MELGKHVGGLKGLLERTLAKLKRDTEENEAVQALKMATGVLADSVDESHDVHELFKQQSEVAEKMEQLPSQKDFNRLEKSIETFRRDEKDARKKLVTDIVKKIPETPTVVSMEVIKKKEGRISRIKRTYSDGSVAEFKVEHDDEGRVKRTVRI